MSWVLILTPQVNQRPPAVIGGYPTRVDAEQAGELATAYSEPEKHENGFWIVKAPDFYAYTVIPGAACAEPLGSTVGSVCCEYFYDGRPPKIARSLYRCETGELRNNSQA
jgi:hypothetical protein